MDTDLSSQDRKDLDKFIKFFALKTVQVIVQARLGEKICTRSSSSPTGSDWFNLAIKDIPEVTHEAKKALAGQLPAVGRSMCVEISLKTSEGDSMELEIWCLEMNEKCDKEIKVSYTVYNRLSLLLKSLLAITRVTPAYRLSRKQGHEYVILYRIYFGEVQLSGLGEGFQTVRVGTVGTPVGTITLSCAYRINLAFMSNRAGEDNGAVYPSVEDSQEVCTTSFSTSPPSQLIGPGKEGGVPPVPSQPAHGTQADQERMCTPLDGGHYSAATPSSSEDTETVSNSSEGKCGSPHDLLETIFIRKVGAFVNKPINQVTNNRSSQRAPQSPTAPICSYTEEQKAPSASTTLETGDCVLPATRLVLHKIPLGCDRHILPAPCSSMEQLILRSHNNATTTSS